MLSRFDISSPCAFFYIAVSSQKFPLVAMFVFY